MLNFFSNDSFHVYKDNVPFKETKTLSGELYNSEIYVHSTSSLATVVINNSAQFEIGFPRGGSYISTN